MSSPWRQGAAQAVTSPVAAMLETFAARIQKNLRGLLEDEQVVVQPSDWMQGDGAWCFLEVFCGSSTKKIELPQLMREVAQVLAEQEGASVIMLPLQRESMIFGMLAQARYWTASRARLMTHEIIKTWDVMNQRKGEPEPRVHR